jgi:hypothetical protein
MVDRDEPGRVLRILVSSTDIAELLGVRNVSTISNWRARHADFPSPAVSGHNALFDVDDVLTWARRTDTPAHPTVPTPTWWWEKTVDAFRREADQRTTDSGGDAVRTYLIAMVLLRAAITGELDGPHSDRHARTWSDLIAARDIGRALRGTAADSEATDDRLAGLLSGPLASISVPSAIAGELATALQRATDAGVGAKEQLDVLLRRSSTAMRARQTSNFTDIDLATLIASIAEPAEREVIYDPCAGEGQLLTECLERTGGRATLVFQEIDEPSSRVARSRLLVAGADFRFGRPAKSSLGEDQFPELRADLVVVDPPVMARHSLSEWVTHALDHVTPAGRCVVTLPAHAFVELPTTRRRPDRQLQDQLATLARDGHVRSVTIVPADLRRDVSGPLTIWCIEPAATAGLPVTIGRIARREQLDDGTERTAVGEGLLSALQDDIEHALNTRSAPSSRTSSGGDVRREFDELRDAIEATIGQLEDADAVDDLRRRLESLAVSLAHLTD